jgi:hypothetical protein
MRGYRCQMFGEDGEVILPTDIVAESLDTAVQCAFRILHASNERGAGSSWIYGFKIWHEPRVEPRSGTGGVPER